MRTGCAPAEEHAAALLNFEFDDSVPVLPRRTACSGGSMPHRRAAVSGQRVRDARARAPASPQPERGRRGPGAGKGYAACRLAGPCACRRSHVERMLLDLLDEPGHIIANFLATPPRKNDTSPRPRRAVGRPAGHRTQPMRPALALVALPQVGGGGGAARARSWRMACPLTVPRACVC